MLDGIAVGIGINATLTGMDKLQQLAAHLTTLSTQTDKVTSQFEKLSGIITGSFNTAHVQSFNEQLQSSVSTAHRLNSEIRDIGVTKGRVVRESSGGMFGSVGSLVGLYAGKQLLEGAWHAAANLGTETSRMRMQGYSENDINAARTSALHVATSTQGVTTTDAMIMNRKASAIIGQKNVDEELLKRMMINQQAISAYTGESVEQVSMSMFRGIEARQHLTEGGKFSKKAAMEESDWYTKGVIAAGGDVNAKTLMHSMMFSSEFARYQQNPRDSMALTLASTEVFQKNAGNYLNAADRAITGGTMFKTKNGFSFGVDEGLIDPAKIGRTQDYKGIVGGQSRTSIVPDLSAAMTLDPTKGRAANYLSIVDKVTEHLSKIYGRAPTEIEKTRFIDANFTKDVSRLLSWLASESGRAQYERAGENIDRVPTGDALAKARASDPNLNLADFEDALKTFASELLNLTDAMSVLAAITRSIKFASNFLHDNPKVGEAVTDGGIGIGLAWAASKLSKILPGTGARVATGAAATVAEGAVATEGIAAGAGLLGMLGGALSQANPIMWTTIAGSIALSAAFQQLNRVIPGSEYAAHLFADNLVKSLGTIMDYATRDLFFSNKITNADERRKEQDRQDALAQFDPMMARSFGGLIPTGRATPEEIAASPALAPHHTISPRPEPYHEPYDYSTNRYKTTQAQMLGYAPMPGQVTAGGQPFATLAPLRHGSQFVPSSNVPVTPQEPIVPGLIPPSFPTSSLQPAPGEPELPTGLAPRSGVAPVVPGLNAPAFPETTARTPESGSSDINVNNIYAKNLYVAALILSGNRSLPGSPLGETGGTTGTAPITGSSPVAIPSAFRTGNRIPAMSPWSNVQPNANETTDGSGVTPISLPSGGVPGIQPGLNDTTGIAPSGVPGIQPTTTFPPPSPSSVGSSGTPPSAGSPTPLAPTSAPFPASAAGSSFPQQAPMVMARLMKDFNLTKQQAAGIVGNLGHESGGFKQLQELNPQGGGKGGFGWAQWTGPRRTAFLENAKSLGLDPKSPEANYSFLSKELRTTESKSLAAVRGQTTEHGSMMAFEGAYERAGIKHYESRDKYTDIALNKFNQQQDIGSGNNMVLPPPSQPNYSMQADIHLDGEHIAQHTFKNMFDTNPAGNAGTTGFDKKMHSWASGTSIPR